ncbi:hypothetical protein LTR97_002514 [Elasticomyces elasticus]|uniref:Uncharacterized protein n=1 Tax=Elasticomyces elasticus TaxID=574655 RepID=A0AAN8A4J2_9PEZI|nr:hypothetical protein LTR97_002514 [Elasticomyces elasticus]
MAKSGFHDFITRLRRGVGSLLPSKLVATEVSGPPNDHDTQPRVWDALQDPPMTIEQESPFTIEQESPLTIEMLVTSPTTGSTTTFRFMDLAGELRNLIYEFILIEPHAVQLGRSAVNASILLWKEPANPPITCTNRQLRREALPIYYDINTFEVRLSSHLRRTSFHYLTAAVDGTAEWLYHLSPERRIPVKNLVLCTVAPRDEMMLPGKEIHRKLRGVNMRFYTSDVERETELRNRIFEYLLTTPSAVLIASDTNSPFCHTEALWWWKATLPPITRVNRQLRNEVTPVYYSINTFEIHLHLNASGHCYTPYAAYGAAAWLRRMGARQRAMLKKIVVCTLLPEEVLPAYFQTFHHEDGVKLGFAYGERLEGYEGGLGHVETGAIVHSYLLDVTVSEDEGWVTGQ